MSYLRFGLCLIYASIALGLHVVPLLPHRRVLERKRKERQLLGMTIDELQIDPLYQGIGVRFSMNACPICIWSFVLYHFFFSVSFFFPFHSLNIFSLFLHSFLSISILADKLLFSLATNQSIYSPLSGLDLFFRLIMLIYGWVVHLNDKH